MNAEKKEFVAKQTPYSQSINNINITEQKEKYKSGWNFYSNKHGVWFHPSGSDDGSCEPIWICSPLLIEALTRDENNENHGRLLKFFDFDGMLHQWTLPMELLASGGSEC